MREFERSGARLRGLPVTGRVVYTIFLAFTLVALGMSMWLAEDMIGASMDGFGAYYRGESGAPDGAAVGGPRGDDAVEGGPTLDLPVDAEPMLAASEPMPRRKLLEVTHFHLFSMPIYLLILSHLFMLSSGRGKLGWIGGATVGTVAHIAAPWLAAAGSAGSAAIYAISGALLAISYVWMAVVPLLDMWTRARAVEPASGTRAA